MIIFPAMDLKDGRCVRLYKGDFDTVHQVADDPLQTALSFRRAGAEWLHMVDLDGAKTGSTANASLVLDIARQCGLKVELGGGIRDRQTLDFYLSHGVERCILGSAALKNPSFVKEAVAVYGERIAVGIDAINGMVAAEGWIEVSTVPYLDMAREMEKCGVKTIIFTDISKDGTLQGPNFEQLKALQQTVSCDIIASGGIRDIEHIHALRELNMYGAICGKSIYSGSLDLSSAIVAADLHRFFGKSSLIPAIVQEASTGDVLMLAFMDKTALERTLNSGLTWFWSRSRQEYWNKGATSGHVQHVVSIAGDCDDDTLLIRVNQEGAACHTGAHSCFFKVISSCETKPDLKENEGMS